MGPVLPTPKRAFDLLAWNVQAGGNQVQRIFGRTVEGRVVLDLDIVKMVRSDPRRSSVMINAGTPMVTQRVGAAVLLLLRKHVARGTLLAESCDGCAMPR